MRYIIYGAGAIGGTIGARLHQAGRDVVLIARGEHFEALERRGLTLKDPHGTVTLQIPCASHPSEVTFGDGDVVFLTMKSQHTLVALEDLRAASGEHIPLICCQNGVANERMAIRRFDHVYAMVVYLPGTHLEPGVVLHPAITCGGVLDAGCFPSGVDGVITAVCADLETAGFAANADPRAMRWKYAKLLNNLSNALQAVTAIGPETQEISRRMIREALACYEAAGIECATREEVQARHAGRVQIGEIDGERRGGGSSWQSVLRGTGNIETDYLNGEIVQLGKLHRVPTPVNRCLLELGNQIIRDGAKAGSMPLADVMHRIDALESAAVATSR